MSGMPSQSVVFGTPRHINVLEIAPQHIRLYDREVV